jgi:hypothetical protein
MVNLARTAGQNTGVPFRSIPAAMIRFAATFHLNR